MFHIPCATTTAIHPHQRFTNSDENASRDVQYPLGLCKKENAESMSQYKLSNLT